MSEQPINVPPEKGPPGVAPRRPLALRLAHGGPFFHIQRKLGLVHETDLRAWPRAALYVSLAWAVPLFLTLPILSGSSSAMSDYLSDPAPLSRFLIGVGCFILAEKRIEATVDEKLSQFDHTALVATGSQALQGKAASLAERRKNAGFAEVICLLLAVAASAFAFDSHRDGSVLTWAATQEVDETVITLAGWWCLFVSIPLFFFLFLRCLWRHVVLVGFLHRLACFNLRLVATHPDGKAGLSFFGNYPNAYWPFVFGASCAIAAALWKHAGQSALSATTFATVMGAWLLIVLVFFAAGLLAFSQPIRAVKEASLQKISAQATIFQRSSERHALGENVAANDPSEKEDLAGPDMTKQYEQVGKVSSLLVDRSMLLPLAAAALLPFSVAGATHIPAKEVLSVFKKLLLL
ncbi:hypothetical protein GAO09_02925 [Rhizobiales bacterium RZME27]|uniref:Uncharacterized protein n=1 Tax=Endobacterium cereale TaxID=2663029 RepID=A0A6A8A5B1_9HYPH|nr:hypothetical protein [Endobacterium cereale]MQY45027.1 hypothetical protein [Endobacterium cereale]